VAATILWVLPAISDEHGLPIHGYGVMILLAVSAGVGLAVWRARRVGVDPELILSLAFWMILPAIVGARAFYVTEYWSGQYWPVYGERGLPALLWAVLNLANGGLVIYGGFFGGVVGLVGFFRKYRVPLLATADLVAPSLMLGLAIGRIGCLLNGCCFGGMCDLPWAVTFPPGSPPYASQVARGVMYGMVTSGDPRASPVVAAVVPHSEAERAGLRPGDRLQSLGGFDVDPIQIKTAGDAHRMLSYMFSEQKSLIVGLADGRTLRLPAAAAPARSRPVHPTQIYSTIDAFLICLLLLAASPFCRRDGQLSALLLTVYPLARLLEESIRTDEAAIRGTGMTISQNVSALLLLCAAGLWFYVRRQPPERAYGRSMRDKG
jgi:phosphatidylglycerol:prolipoprotein diacylglycerol transferase